MPRALTALPPHNTRYGRSGQTLCKVTLAACGHQGMTEGAPCTVVGELQAPQPQLHHLAASVAQPDEVRTTQAGDHGVVEVVHLLFVIISHIPGNRGATA